MEAKRLDVFKHLCVDHSNGYVKINDQYFGIRTELFDFAFIRKMLKMFITKKFKVETYQGNPVVMEIELEYEEAFKLLQDSLLSGKTPQFTSDQSLMNFLIILDRIATHDEMKPLLQGLEFSETLLTQLPQVGISPFFLSCEIRLKTCLRWIEAQWPQFPKQSQICKYGKACWSLTDQKFICNYLHAYQSSDVSDQWIRLLTLKRFQEVALFVNYYGFILGQFQVYDPTYQYFCQSGEKYFKLIPIEKSVYFILVDGWQPEDQHGSLHETFSIEGREFKLWKKTTERLYYCPYSCCARYMPPHPHGN